MSQRGDTGLLISIGTFAWAAKAAATRDGAPPIDLIGGGEFCDLVKQYGLGVEVEKRNVEEVTVDEGFFDSTTSTVHASSLIR